MDSKPEPIAYIILVVSLCVATTYAQSAQGLQWAKSKQTIITDTSATNAIATYWFTNQTSQTVTISRIKPSCTCTSIRSPAQLPAIVQPGAKGFIRLDSDIGGKRGFLYKSAQIFSSAGTHKLEFSIAINANGRSDRAQNQAIAKTDRQAVFRGQCATCHADPSDGKTGAQLFQAACGICHDAEHRASMVPDLRTHPLPNRPHLEVLIRHGKPNSLMPAFHQREGGPLTDEQIRSLVSFLKKGFGGK